MVDGLASDRLTRNHHATVLFCKQQNAKGCTLAILNVPLFRLNGNPLLDRTESSMRRAEGVPVKAASAELFPRQRLLLFELFLHLGGNREAQEFSNASLFRVGWVLRIYL